MTSLQDRLDAITEQTRRLVQPERLAIGERAIADLHASGIESSILPVGAEAPQFALADAAGRTVRSSDLLALGRPLILVFFRGRWCPYCVTQLEWWRDRQSSVHEAGALLLAVSPQTVHQNDLMVQQHALPFPVLRDEGCRVANQFGVAYSLSEYQQRYYCSILVNIPFINGEQSWRLPIPATFVLSPAGTVLHSIAHADFRVRPEPEEILDVIYQQR